MIVFPGFAKCIFLKTGTNGFSRTKKVIILVKMGMMPNNM